jgi:hypothetical protein
MSIFFKPTHSVSRLGFVAEVADIELTRELAPIDVDAVHEGMFRDQKLSDEQQLVFSRQLGPFEAATGDIARPIRPPHESEEPAGESQKPQEIHRGQAAPVERPAIFEDPGSSV